MPAKRKAAAEMDALAEDLAGRVMAKVRSRIDTESRPSSAASTGYRQEEEHETVDVDVGIIAGVFCGPADKVTGGQSLFQSGSIGVADRVPDEVKEKIWSGEFVEMAELLDKKDKAKLSTGKMPGGDKGREVLPELLPFELWSKAWNRYQAILVRQVKTLNLADPGKLSEDLAHHMEMVSAIKEKHANWGFYEREFRLLVARGEATWGKSHLELLIHTFPFKESTERDVGAGLLSSKVKASSPRTLPTGACFRYQRTGSCVSGPACRFQHACVNCFGAHPVAHCQRPLGNLQVKESFRKRMGVLRQEGRQFGALRQQPGRNGGPQQHFLQGQQPFITSQLGTNQAQRPLARLHRRYPLNGTSNERGLGFHYEEVKGNLFDSDPVGALAHCVSQDFAMAAGIALQFRDRYGNTELLKQQEVQIGGFALLNIESKSIFYLVTKSKYNHKPTYAALKASLTAMRNHCAQRNIWSIAMPKIGCGLDRLNWFRVSRIIKDVFSNTGMWIRIFSLPKSNVRPRSRYY